MTQSSNCFQRDFKSLQSYIGLELVRYEHSKQKVFNTWNIWWGNYAFDRPFSSNDPHPGDWTQHQFFSTFPSFFFSIFFFHFHSKHNYCVVSKLIIAVISLVTLKLLLSLFDIIELVSMKCVSKDNFCFDLNSQKMFQKLHHLSNL